MAAPRPVQEPQKELRFTRRRIAQFFGVLAMVSLLGVILVSYVVIRLYFRDDEIPSVPSPWLVLIFGVLATASLRMMILCVRHAYILLTPLGVEIIPLYNPGKRMRVVFWPELKSAEIVSGKLILNLDTEPPESIRLSLIPLSKEQQSMLIYAIQGTLKKRDAPQESTTSD